MGKPRRSMSAGAVEKGKSYEEEFIFCLAALLALSMCACAGSDNDPAYTVTKNGTGYVVDWESGAISDGTYTYPFTFSGSGSSYSIEIVYPDGSSYWWHKQTSGGFSSGSGGWSDDYDEDRYVSGDVLRDILEAGAPKQTNGIDGGRLLISLVLLALGLFNVISPHTAWYLRYGWRYKDTEPSELALGVGRLGSVAIIVIAVLLLFL